nr:hypothetical protein [Thalassotalea litorea]
MTECQSIAFNEYQASQVTEKIGMLTIINHIGHTQAPVKVIECCLIINGQFNGRTFTIFQGRDLNADGLMMLSGISIAFGNIGTT